ncbi:AMP-dependent synthetase [Paenibacillus helianthi]|uniref:AMP-dependent synthetase n=1 Tax=Paenibacillus helianthi TaxID=1349432 RepID=A0ABX3EW84_9BACL|nr:AMP-binding protein [Paenibacillus helianthi]OKP90458.1 AMP-dependent synthetase [Paenibacillus helianthi]
MGISSMNANSDLYIVPKFSNFRDLLNYSAGQYANQNAFQIKKENGTYRIITYKDLIEQYYSLCAEFIRRDLLGKRIAVIGNNSYGWVLSYLCAATVGVAVPIDKELCAEEIQDFCEAAECSIICADNATREKLIQVDSSFLQYSHRDIENFRVSCSEHEKRYIDSIALPIDEMRVLIFTSGTTGNAKGVCLSQNNICANIYQTTRIVQIKPGEKTISVLPLHHTYECTLNCLLQLSRGACISYCDGLTKIAQNIQEYRPSVMVVVPALLKMMSKRIRLSVAKECPEKYRALFQEKSLAQALAEVPFFIRKIIRAKVRKTLGGKLRLVIVGAAELDTSLVDDFSALGIRALQGYGLTECAPLLAGNSDFFLDPASTGCAIPGVILKILSPNETGVGEVAVKGENVMLGYYQDEAATCAAMQEGFFLTGDLGCIDDKGALFIKGRIKNVIVTSNGKNIYPEEMETRLGEAECISESLVLEGKGPDGESCVKAKVLPNIEFIKEKLGHFPSFEEIQLYVKSAINELNSKLPSYKRIHIIVILEQGLERTTTQKIKRYGVNLA